MSGDCTRARLRDIDAVAAVFKRRRGCARRLFYTDAAAARAEPWAAFLREKGEAAERLTDDELRKLDPEAAQGVLLETERPLPRPPTYAEIAQWRREARALICVCGIRGADLGALAREAANAGFSRMILLEDEPIPDGDAYDAARGALESLNIYRATRFFLRDIRSQFLCATTGSSGRPLAKLKPPRAPGRPLCFVACAAGKSFPCELSVAARLDDAAERAELFRVLQRANTAVN